MLFAPYRRFADVYNRHLQILQILQTSANDCLLRCLCFQRKNTGQKAGVKWIFRVEKSYPSVLIVKNLYNQHWRVTFLVQHSTSLFASTTQLHWAQSWSLALWSDSHATWKPSIWYRQRYLNYIVYKITSYHCIFLPAAAHQHCKIWLT